MLNVLIALFVSVLVGRLIFKGYKSQPVLFLGGIILMLFSIVLKTGEILPVDESTGFVIFDIFQYIANMLGSRAAGLGMTIMTVSGFAKYMDHIGASKSLVDISIAPIRKIDSPYLILAVGYIIGQLLNVFIPSASGLGVLLMVTMYPVFISAGVSKLSATALIGTTACMDLGPASGNANMAASTIGIDTSIYFSKYQIPVAILVGLGIAIAHYWTQKYFDEKDGYVLGSDMSTLESDEKLEKSPKWYAIFPMIPLVMTLVFSDLLVSSIKMSVSTAMIISFTISYVVELIRKGGAKKTINGIQVFFDGMAGQFANVVTLIVAGETFASGLKNIGAIDIIISSAQNVGFGGNMMIIIMTMIIAVTAVIMGSGNAPFFAFAALAPDTATKLGVPVVKMVLPMQYAAGIARSVSPITSVIVAVSGVSEVSPFDVVKRTMIPMSVGLILTLVGTFVFI